MMFLAITLGFFADNLRESRAERVQERVLIEQVLEDLLEDRLAADSNLALRDWREAKLDSLLLMHRQQTATTHTADFYYFAQIVRNRYLFVPHSGAFAQLDGGGLKLVTNRTVLRAIQRYRSQLNEVEQMQQLEEDQTQRYRNGPILRLLDPTIVRDITHQEAETLDRRVDRPAGRVSLHTADAATLNEFFMLTQSTFSFNRTCTRLVKGIRRAATQTAQLIAHEYGLPEPTP
ncbi:MAG: hypothetical protein WCK74_06435 [Gemmatimonadaceae bacterium]